MERLSASNNNGCTVLCITKVLLFVLIYMLILYLPLEEFVQCCPDFSKHVYFCICDVYESLLDVGHKISIIIEDLIMKILDLLYETKLQFYSLLAKLDKPDLCRCAHCQMEQSHHHRG